MASNIFSEGLEAPPWIYRPRALNLSINCFVSGSGITWSTRQVTLFSTGVTSMPQSFLLKGIGLLFLLPQITYDLGEDVSFKYQIPP